MHLISQYLTFQRNSKQKKFFLLFHFVNVFRFILTFVVIECHRFKWCTCAQANHILKKKTNKEVFGCQNMGKLKKRVIYFGFLKNYLFLLSEKIFENIFLLECLATFYSERKKRSKFVYWRLLSPQTWLI